MKPTKSDEKAAHKYALKFNDYNTNYLAFIHGRLSKSRSVLRILKKHDYIVVEGKKISTDFFSDAIEEIKGGKK